MPGNWTVFERTVEPAFRRRVGRGPRSRHGVRKDMKANAFVQMFGSLQRTSQEMLWDGVGETVARQAARRDRRARGNGQRKGRARSKLALDASLRPPAYMPAVDIHCMPGGYVGETVDETAAGAIYDLGVYHYAMSSLGPRQ